VSCPIDADRENTIPMVIDLTWQVIAREAGAENTRSNLETWRMKMRAVNRIWIIVVVLIALPVHAEQGVGDYRGLPTDLAAAATAYDIAQMKSDRSGLERLLADDYILANISGRNESKTESIADSVMPGNKTTYVAISRQVRKAWSNGAVLGGMVDAKGIDHGKPYTMRARFVDVWAKRDGQWQVIFTQIHRVLPGG
jgi:hypothetical protein